MAHEKMAAAKLRALRVGMKKSPLDLIDRRDRAAAVAPPASVAKIFLLFPGFPGEPQRAPARDPEDPISNRRQFFDAKAMRRHLTQQKESDETAEKSDEAADYGVTGEPKVAVKVAIARERFLLLEGEPGLKALLAFDARLRARH